MKERMERGVAVPAIRRLLLDLPNVVEGRYYGMPSFLLNGRFLARFRDGGTVLVLQLAAISDRDTLIDLDAGAFFFTEHYRNYPSVLVRLAEVDRALLEEAIAEAWRQLARARRVKTSKDAERAAESVSRSAASPGRKPRPRRAAEPRREPHQ
jgi:hypothetical protein